MDAAEAATALQEVGFAALDVRPIGDGWANWTFLVDDDLIARFPRNRDIAAATQRELALLPVLADHVAFHVPIPIVVGVWAGMPFFAYRRISGRPLEASDGGRPSTVETLRRMLSELHSFPLDRAAQLLGAPPAERAWRLQYEVLWDLVEEAALPEMDRPLADRVRHEYAEMLDHTPVFPSCFIHNDLGPMHVLLDDNSHHPVGIIDFEDAWIGDPATDLTPLVATLGWPTLDVLTEGRDLGDRLTDRITFYRWMGSVHAIIYGVTQDVGHERDAGLTELRRRLPTS